MSATLSPEWHISKNGYDILNENPNITRDQLLKLALDTDVKEICNPILTSELSKERTSKIVLQIQKIRNISAPKANEESQAAPRLLKLSLTDGESFVQALELLPLNFINRNIPPGTKLLINNAKIACGYLLLTPDNCSLLGGRVPALIEKWEITKNINNTQRRNSNEDGPPPWVNFGSKIQKPTEDANFKSLGGKTKEANKGNSEFELQRQGAIAEATSGATKKIFGGKVTQNIQAVRNQRIEKKDTSKLKTKGTFKSREIEEKPEKPQEKVSLFSFLEDKLPVDEVKNFNKDKPLKENKNYTENSFDNDNGYYNKQFIQPQYSTDKSAKPNNSNEFFHRAPDKKNSKQHQTQKPYSYHYHLNDQKNAYQMTPIYKEEKTNTFHHPQKNNFLDNKYTNDMKSSSKASNQSTSAYKDKKNVEETTQLLTKMSLNSQFASRSLRQHLNLGGPKQDQSNNIGSEANSPWKVGDECLAKYWEDGKFYDAKILGVTEKTIVVKFYGYENIEEVLRTDCMPSSQKNYRQMPHRSAGSHSGSMEFRRSSRNFN